ncbi:hypothetical protein [Variovorax paradoxus]|uniref:hypothetical protein n=1 Tax=Variovorax paradoxus TaxID=34073 RepID=UPI0019327986|nr:hypothetical protein INQ48_43375 [Variovorax paradoxus]
MLAGGEVLASRSGKLNHALRAPALGELAKVWAKLSQVVAIGERLVTFDCSC